MSRSIILAVVLGLAAPISPTALAAGDAGATQAKAVQFAKGKTSAKLRGSIRGDGDATYTINTRAGQTLAVASTSNNGSLNFNIVAPGSQEAMFVGSLQGSKASVMLPTDGDYTIQIYLMRNAARRSESASYTLEVAVTGQALVPLPAAQDALVPGTRFHATATVPCETLGAGAASCQADVIRRGRDGTATIELRNTGGAARRVLFVKGQPVASDSAQPMTSTRQGNQITVRFGGNERYDLPDALVTGD
jgi:hypothetical protein